MQVSIKIRLYEYGYEQVNYENKRWNDKEMLLNINMQSEC
jgi:hypothetical protein